VAVGPDEVFRNGVHEQTRRRDGIDDHEPRRQLVDDCLQAPALVLELGRALGDSALELDVQRA
jgi:hypothetical protein